MFDGWIHQVIQVGAIPPPFGGVSVHLSRLLERLVADNVPCALYDISGIPKHRPGVECRSWRNAFLTLMRRQSAIVHLHNFSPRNLYLYSLMAIRHRTVLSFHNERFVEELRSYSPLEQGLFLRLLDNLDAIVVDSDTNRERALKLGIATEKLRTFPEFIPPRRTEPSASDIPHALRSLRERHRFLLSTNAFQLAFHRGEDMYGIDLIIEATNRLVGEAGLDVATAILLPNHGNEAYLAQLQSRIATLGLTDRCLLITEPLAETAQLWQMSDVVIRATNTDGNSLSILEALSCGTPVVASDCVPRHPAVSPFANRDADDLSTALNSVLSDLGNHRSRVAGLQFEDNAGSLISLYRSLDRR